MNKSRHTISRNFISAAYNVKNTSLHVVPTVKNRKTLKLSLKGKIYSIKHIESWLPLWKICEA